MLLDALIKDKHMDWGKYLGAIMADVNHRAEEKEKELEERKSMGQRILITGVQLGMMQAHLKLVITLLDGSKHPEDHPNNEDVLANARRELDSLEKISDEQWIGQSQNPIEEDVIVFQNLHASWIGQTHDI